MSTQSRRGRQVQRKGKRRSSQTLIIFYWIIGAIVVAGVVFVVTVAMQGGFASDAPTTDYSNIPTGMTEDGYYYKGSPDAPVQVIEYSDFQCPACAQFVLNQGQRLTTHIEEGAVQLIYHDLPLNIHPNAAEAAEAARCAGDQNQFWQMHDLLFARQSEWASLSSPLDRFVGYAGDLGLDRGTFESCLTNGQHTPHIADSIQAANAVQIVATPTFMVNGQQLNSVQLIPVIDAALAAEGRP